MSENKKHEKFHENVTGNQAKMLELSKINNKQIVNNEQKQVSKIKNAESEKKGDLKKI